MCVVALWYVVGMVMFGSAGDLRGRRFDPLDFDVWRFEDADPTSAEDLDAKLRRRAGTAIACCCWDSYGRLIPHIHE